ncbi:hypothetical protein ABW21_db0200180 [Orbilia brochopaga]|nr:hypothetical protein ABW21_db0200180 [Drechslerella brochopaga]
MEISLIAPLVKTAYALYEGLEACKDLDHSISALVAQVRALHRSITVLEETARMRHLNRSFHQPFNSGKDPTEQQLGALLKDIDGTHEEVEAFFKENSITLDIPKGIDKRWDVRAESRLRITFKQNSIQTRLRAFEQRYQALAKTVSDLSNALVLHTIQESINNLQSDDHMYTPKQRFRDPSLLTRPRTVRADARSETSESYVAGKRVSGYTESCAIESTISEEQLQAEARKTYTRSQAWLFQQFEDELQRQSIMLEDFEIWYLLKKVLLWVGEDHNQYIVLLRCKSDHSSLNLDDYAINYVLLMKAAWLLSEKIMKVFPAESTLGQFNESVLIEVQYRIHALQPTGREPPSLVSMQNVPRDVLELGLSPGEQQNIAQTETQSINDPSEAVIFQR